MKPNFLCIGTFRAGTSWLFQVLKKHPEIFLPEEKELMFFTWHYGRGIDWYERFYTDYRGQRYAGDISPPYLSSEEAPGRIRKHLSDIKIVAVLRNPVDQIWSLYNLWLTRNYTRKDLRVLLREENELLNNVLYFKHLSNYLKYFDRKDLLILLYDNLKTDPVAFLSSVYNFLEIEPLYSDDLFKIWNPTRNPKSILVEKVIAKGGDFLHRSGLIPLKVWLNKVGINQAIKSLNTRRVRKQSIPSDVRSSINAYVKNDAEQLAELISRDLSFWK